MTDEYRSTATKTQPSDGPSPQVSQCSSAQVTKKNRKSLRTCRADKRSQCARERPNPYYIKNVSASLAPESWTYTGRLPSTQSAQAQVPRARRTFDITPPSRFRACGEHSIYTARVVRRLRSRCHIATRYVDPPGYYRERPSPW